VRIALAIALVLLLGVATWLAAPRCRPGDGDGWRIGGQLIAGCDRRTSQ
jgi:hypothetical protein